MILLKDDEDEDDDGLHDWGPENSQKNSVNRETVIADIILISVDPALHQKSLHFQEIGHPTIMLVLYRRA